MSFLAAARQIARRFERRYPLRQGHPLYRPLFALRARFARQFFVELNHGLANRLATLVTCQAAAEQLGREVRFIWQVNRLCGCEFNDLFDNELPLAEPRRIIDFNDDTTCEQAFLTSRKSFLYTGPGIEQFSKCRDGRWDLNNIPFITGRRDAAAESFSQWLTKLRPAREVLERIPPIPENSIGIHVRRADLPWQHLSSTETFLGQVEEFANSDLHLAFFLATDADDVKSLFRGRLRQRLIVVPEPSVRTSAEGMQVALADMLGLSRTKMVLGTFNSSFSWLSTMWRLIPLSIVRSDSV